jgi:DNA polymerase
MVDTLTFMNRGKGGTQRREETYGCKLVENLIQSVARDVLCCGLIAAHEAGFEIVMHTHDEIVCEQQPGDGLDHHLLEHLMSLPPSWVPTLLLGAEGYENVFYVKQASGPARQFRSRPRTWSSSRAEKLLAGPGGGRKE